MLFLGQRGPGLGCRGSHLIWLSVKDQRSPNIFSEERGLITDFPYNTLMTV